MQENKLQELTDKLYREGLSKGQQEAGALLARAQDEAQQIVAEAREAADRLLAEAQKEAAGLKTATDNELRLATRQVMATVKQAIEQAVTAKVLGEPVSRAMSDSAFLRQLILAVAGRFDPQQSAAGLSLLLPESERQQLQAFAEGQLRQQLGQGLSVQFDRSFRAGFKIGVVGSGYHVSLTDGDFEQLFRHFLRARLNDILFKGE